MPYRYTVGFYAVVEAGAAAGSSLFAGSATGSAAGSAAGAASVGTGSGAGAGAAAGAGELVKREPNRCNLKSQQGTFTHLEQQQQSPQSW
jgi:hypothetical protein